MRKVRMIRDQIVSFFWNVVGEFGKEKGKGKI